MKEPGKRYGSVEQANQSAMIDLAAGVQFLRSIMNDLIAQFPTNLSGENHVLERIRCWTDAQILYHISRFGSDEQDAAYTMFHRAPLVTIIVWMEAQRRALVRDDEVDVIVQKRAIPEDVN